MGVRLVDQDAAERVGPIKLTATAMSGDATITRELRPYTRVWKSPRRVQTAGIEPTPVRR